MANDKEDNSDNNAEELDNDGVTDDVIHSNILPTATTADALNLDLTSKSLYALFKSPDHWEARLQNLLGPNYRCWREIRDAYF